MHRQLSRKMCLFLFGLPYADALNQWLLKLVGARLTLIFILRQGRSWHQSRNKDPLNLAGHHPESRVTGAVGVVKCFDHSWRIQIRSKTCLSVGVLAMFDSQSLVFCQRPRGCVCFQYPLKCKHSSRAPRPNRKVPPNNASSLGVFAICSRAEPTNNAPKNLKGIWSSKYFEVLLPGHYCAGCLLTFMK